MFTLLNKSESKGLYEQKIVLIFSDPITKTDLEGKATLIEPFQKHKDMEFWLVSFLARPEEIAFRWVSKDE